MGNLDGKLVYRGGHLCIEYVSRDFTEPIEWTLFWPICELGEADAKLLPIGASARDIGEGRYMVQQGDERAREYVLLNAGQTIPLETARADLKPPKGEVRWRNGYWERHSERKGWTRIYN